MSLRRASTGFIRANHRYLSPMLPPFCSYAPSCSVHTARDIEEYDVPGRVLIGNLRALCCRSFARGGYDPVR